MKEQKTTEDLRKILFDTIDQVANGSIDVNKGRTIATLADKLIRTAEVELEYCAIEARLKGNLPMPMVLTGRLRSDGN